MSGIIKPEDRPEYRPVKRNCWTCVFDYGESESDRFCMKQDLDHEDTDAVVIWSSTVELDAAGMPHEDADGCPGWMPLGRACIAAAEALGRWPGGEE